jgi:hypothetical protein
MGGEGNNMSDRMSLKKLIGQEISYILKRLSAEGEIQLRKAVLRGVDMGGIWVEDNYLTQGVLKQDKLAVGNKTPVMFLPYSELYTIFCEVDLPSLSESSFGLK